MKVDKISLRRSVKTLLCVFLLIGFFACMTPQGMCQNNNRNNNNNNRNNNNARNNNNNRNNNNRNNNRDWEWF